MDSEDVDEAPFSFQDSKTVCNLFRPRKLEVQTETPSSSTMEYLHSAGTVEKDGDMVLFFSEDLETKIKLSSPGSKQESLMGCGDISKNSAPCLYRQALQPSVPPLDATVLNSLEADARKVATAVDSLTENLAGLLHSVSALTVDCLETYRDAVCNTCDAVDSNIKSMYQLMAKCEELSKTMRPVYKLAEQIKEIKRLLDLYENAVTT